MTKKYRLSQMLDITGPQIYGLEVHKYGLPYNGAGGAFHAEKPDLVELVLAAVERHPEIHIVTRMHDDRVINRYVPESEGAFTYRLFLGNADPELEFFGWSQDDISQEEHERFIKFIEEGYNEPLNTTQVAAVNWMINEIENAGKKATTNNSKKSA